MALITFLANAVSPTVAAAAAQTALDEFIKQRKEEANRKNADDGKTEEKTSPFTKENVRSIAATALGAAVIKAQVI